MIVDAIKRRMSDILVFGDYIRPNIQLMANFMSIEVVFVKRGLICWLTTSRELLFFFFFFGSSHCWSDPPNFVDG